MNLEYVIRDFEDLFPELSTIGNYSSTDGLVLKKSNTKNDVLSPVKSILENTLLNANNKEIITLKIDAGSQSGFFYFHKAGYENWILLGSEKPIFGLVNLFIQQLEIEEEGTSEETGDKPLQKSQKAGAEVDESDLMSAFRMQKRFLRKIDFLSNKVSKKAMYFQPLNKVSGCSYWYKNFESSCILAIADTNISGINGAIVTFSINSIFNDLFVTEDVDLLEAVDEISSKAHSYNLNITTEEDLETLKEVEVGILKLDFETGKMNYATNGIPLLLKSGDSVIWEGVNLNGNNVKKSYDLDGLGPVLIMNNEVARTYTQNILEKTLDSLENEPMLFNNEGLIKCFSEGSKQHKPEHDMTMIGLNEIQMINEFSII